jgi:hypothetical protein
LLQIEQHVAEQLTRRRERSGRDGAFLGRIFALSGGTHRLQRGVASPSASIECGRLVVLNRDLLRPARLVHRASRSLISCNVAIDFCASATAPVWARPTRARRPHRLGLRILARCGRLERSGGLQSRCSSTARGNRGEREDTGRSRRRAGDDIGIELRGDLRIFFINACTALSPV